jgi:hypothetical protein
MEFLRLSGATAGGSGNPLSVFSSKFQKFAAGFMGLAAA